MWETQVQSLGREDSLEKEMATHSSTLAWRIPWMEEPGELQSIGSQRVGHNWAASLTSLPWEKDSPASSPMGALAEFHFPEDVEMRASVLPCCRSEGSAVPSWVAAQQGPLLHQLSQWEEPERENSARGKSVFCSILWEVISNPFYCLLFVTSKSLGPAHTLGFFLSLFLLKYDWFTLLY